jgi:hemoglobin
MGMPITKLWLGLLMAVFIAGCSSMSQQSMGDKSLYERLGGKEAITAVVDDFVGRVAADKRINGFFAKANVPRLKMMLVDQICEATGGPCKYTGRDMKSAHQGMGITNADFDALVGDLVASLDKFKVGEREKQELLAALGPILFRSSSPLARMALRRHPPFSLL